MTADCVQQVLAPQPAAIDRRTRWRLWDALLALLVLVLAFLASSFLARNSDLWFHLATGRLIAQGQFSFGADPFSYTTTDTYWACHAWLFDLALYKLYGLVGGGGLVVLKALLVAALTGLLLLVRRPAGAAWPGVVCTALAVLAMTPRLLLQPACASYFLLALTFWLLWRNHASEKDESAGTPRSAFILHPSSFILLLVFVLWVNVDEWFLLGPLLVALFWLGERLAGQRRTPGWLIPAGLAACLLNPYTFHAFTLPPELSPVTWTSGLRQDPRFGTLFASPWQPAYLRAARALNAAALAYFSLLVLGMFSFVLYRRALASWRLVVWVPFAVLAAWQARAIPFFAVVAAPITALNLQDFLAQRQSAAVPGRTASLGALAGRGLLSLALLALVALAWPGWLAGPGRQERPVAWGVQAEPSLQRVAEVLRDWRSRGLLADNERVFALSPEVAQYGAWFDPGEKHFFDHRYPLFAGTARDYEDVCRALAPGIAAAEPVRDWREALREQGVAVVVLFDRDSQRLFAAMRRLSAERGEWSLLNVAGQAVVFGWNKARPTGGFSPLAFDADRLALGPQDERAQGELPIAPGEGPSRLPAGGDIWDRLQAPPAPPSWESAVATAYLHHFHDCAPRERAQQLHRSLGTFAASLTGLPAQPAGVTLAAFQLFTSRHLLLPRDRSSSFLVRDQLGPYFGSLVERSPALPLLAVRAARRAVAANPSDANAWLRLGQAYLLLRHNTCERSSEGMLPPLAQLRFVQVVTALEQAVRLDPDLEAAHHELGYLYGESNALDMALEHRRAEARISRRAGRRPGESTDEWAHRLELLDRDIAKLEETVKKGRDKYTTALRSLQGKRVEQARVALQLGLARLAADDVLLQYPADLLGSPGIKMELEVLLSLGRADDVRASLREDAMAANKHLLPYYDIPSPMTLDGAPLYVLPYSWPSYDWLQALQAAAVGDYAQARLSLHALRAALQASNDRLKQQRQALERGTWEIVGGFFSGPPPLLPAFAAQSLRAALSQRDVFAAGERSLRAQQADLCVVEGLLALEQGVTDDAWLALAEAQRHAAPAGGTVVRYAGSPIAAAYLSWLSRFRK
jgi:hypothetical protein